MNETDEDKNTSDESHITLRKYNLGNHGWDIRLPIIEGNYEATIQSLRDASEKLEATFNPPQKKGVFNGNRKQEVVEDGKKE